MTRLIATFMAVLLGGFANLGYAADNCEPIRVGIESAIAGKGVVGFSVTVVDLGASVTGRVVGQCANGSKKIIYTRGNSLATQAAASAPSVLTPADKVAVKASVKPATPSKPATAPPKNAGIITECKDGSVSKDGQCKR